MNRRSFIKNTALAATLVGIAPSAMAADLKGGRKKKVIFVLRGVSFSDAENALKKANILDLNVHLQKVICTNHTFSHQEGFSNIFSGQQIKSTITESQHCDRYQFSQLLPDIISVKDNNVQIVHLHHTEIGHSSNKLYLEKIDEFFTELKNIYDPQLHRFIITSDIGRNEKLNSCGGRDHSNDTCFETFAIFMGGKASKLKPNTNSIKQFQILEQKF
jgi:hypothetical protein